MAQTILSFKLKSTVKLKEEIKRVYEWYLKSL
jgi:hypothetical protein